MYAAVTVGKGLEIRFTLTGNGGSNPSLSANSLHPYFRWCISEFDSKTLLTQSLSCMIARPDLR